MYVSRKIWRRFVRSVVAGSVAISASAMYSQESKEQPPAVQPPAETKTETGQPPSSETAAGQPPVPLSDPMADTEPTSLLSQLGSGQSRAAATPGATGFVDTSGADAAAPAIDTTDLARESNTAGSIAGVRRSPIAIQPVVRGYQQQSIYGQYNGANYTPVRFDLDSILSNVDPGIVDNLIIISGPYGVKYGPGLAFIDVVPKPTPRYDCYEVHGRTDLLYQTQGEQLYGRQTIFGGASDWGYRISYGHKIGNDYESGDGTDIPASYKVRDLDIALGFDISDCTKIEFEYLRQDLTDTEYAGLIFDADFRKTDAVALRYIYDDGCCSKLLMEAWYNRTVMEGDNLNSSKQRFYRNNRFFDGTVGGTAGAFVGFTDADVHNTGFRIVPTWGSEGGPKLTAGFDFHYTEQELHEFDDFNVTVNPPGFGPFPIPRSFMADTGIFAEIVNPVDDCTTVTAGARLDWIHANADGSELAVVPGVGGTDNAEDIFRGIKGTGLTQNETLYAYFISMDRKLDEGLDLRLGAGHSQRPASLTERYAIEPFLTFYQRADQFPTGNPDLDPERAWQVDAAVTSKNECGRFRAAAFASYVEDYITIVSTSGDFVNTEARLFGVELSGEHDLSPCMLAFGNFNYLDGRDVERHQEPLPSIYPIQTRLGVRWHEPENNRYGVELSARIVDNQDLNASSVGERETPGFTVYDLRGYWQACENVRFTAGIENLTDKNYLDHLSVHDPRVLEPGINLYLSMSITY